jgi:hypothetical protein
VNDPVISIVTGFHGRYDLHMISVEGVKFTLFGFIMVHINFRDVNHVLSQL